VGKWLVLTCSFVVSVQTVSWSQVTELVSVGSNGAQADGGSSLSSMSADGRYVAFLSNADNLVDGAHGAGVFVRARLIGITTLVSVSTSGEQGNGTIEQPPSISGDGRFVAFSSYATNLVPNDTNDRPDVFVHDRETGVTTRVSVASDGTQADDGSYKCALSGDGRYVAFESNAHNLAPSSACQCGQIFVHDLQTGATTHVSKAMQGGPATSWCNGPAISADGRFVAFYSSADDLVAGDTNGQFDVFVRDLLNGSTERVSVSSSGGQGNSASESPAISADGRFVGFFSWASNLVPDDTNGKIDVFVHDRRRHQTQRVSVGSGGVQANGDSSEWPPSLSANGRFAAFSSTASNLVQGDLNGAQDIFVHVLLFDITTRESVGTGGLESNDWSGDFSLSADGRLLSFASPATNLVPVDKNGQWDIFVRDRGAASAFHAFCFGDGSGAACPCDNSGSPAHGCDNSVGSGGALLSAAGQASLSAATVVLTSSGELDSVLSIVFQGSAAIAPVTYGDGLRCLDGTLLRLYVKVSVAGTATAPEPGDPSIPARSGSLGDSIGFGSSRFYHVYYRDLSASFCPEPPGSLFNVTNAMAIAWGS